MKSLAPRLNPLTPRQERFCHEFVHWAQGAVASRSPRPALFPAPALQEAGSGATATGVKKQESNAKASNCNETR